MKEHKEDLQSTIENMIEPQREEVYTKDKTKRSLRGLIFAIVMNLLVVGYFVYSEGRSGQLRAERIALSDIRPVFILLAIACFAVALAVEAVKYTKLLMVSSGRYDRRGALNAMLIGKYTDNVTPFGAGGQPFQIGYLHRRGYSPGVSSAVTIAGFLTQQVAFLIVALFVLIFGRDIIASIGILKIVAVFGLLLYAVVPLAIVLFAAFPKAFNVIIGGILKLLHKIHIIKDIEHTKKSVFHTLDEYVGSLRLMSSRPYFVMRMLVLSVIYQVAILSIPYFALRAFGGAMGWWPIFAMTVYIYATITVIPTPGNSGAAEGSFLMVFGSLESGLLFWAMLMWRALVYYTWIVIGLVVSTHSMVNNSLPRKKTVPREGPLCVAEVIDTYFPTIDGVVQTVNAYAKYLTEKGHKPVVICPVDSGRDNSAFPYEIIDTPKFRIPFFQFAIPWSFLTRRELKTMREYKFDVIHAHSPFMLGSLAVRLGKKLNVPVIATFHSKYYDDALHITHSKWLARFVMNYVVDFYCHVDAVWACSKATADTLRSYGFRGEIRVMENGVSPAPDKDPKMLKARAREALSLPQGKKILLFVGQQIWHKNLRRVLEVTKALCDRHDDYVTVIAGSGYDSEAIKNCARELKLGDRALFVGRISDREMLFGLYENADLFFFPSMYDNAPLVLREAALCGVPALLAEGSNAAEVVTDGVNGFVAPDDTAAMTDKIEAIFRRDDLDKVRLSARQTIPVLWTEIIDRAVEQYRAV